MYSNGKVEDALNLVDYYLRKSDFKSAEAFLNLMIEKY